MNKRTALQRCLCAKHRCRAKTISSGRTLHQVEIIHHIQVTLGTCHSRIHPLVNLRLIHLAYIARQVEVYPVPLTALRLVTSQGIAPGAAQCIQEWVGIHPHPEFRRILPDALRLHPAIEVHEQFLMLLWSDIQGVLIEERFEYVLHVQSTRKQHIH